MPPHGPRRRCCRRSCRPIPRPRRTPKKVSCSSDRHRFLLTTSYRNTRRQALLSIGGTAMRHALLDTARGTRANVTARLSMVEALVNMLDANRFSAATVADFGLGQWHMAALAARVRDPGLESQAMVVRVLRRREAARAAVEPGFRDAAAGTASNGSDCIRRSVRQPRRIALGPLRSAGGSQPAAVDWNGSSSTPGASDFGRKRTPRPRPKSSSRPHNFK